MPYHHPPVIDAPIDDDDENSYLFATLAEAEKEAIYDLADRDPYGDGPLPKPAKPKAEPKPRKPYDPGQPKGIRKLSPGLYEVLSFREEGKAYRVDLRNGSCSCPAHAKNPSKECKHLLQAWEEAAKEAFFEALAQPIPAIRKAIERTARPEVKASLLRVLAHKLDRFQPDL